MKGRASWEGGREEQRTLVEREGGPEFSGDALYVGG